MHNPEDRARKKIDRAIDRYADEIGHEEMEMLLQKRAQDMREQQSASVEPEDIEGWSA